jgi:hypothetical protein
MGIGKFKVSYELLKQVFDFPEDWKIEFVDDHDNPNTFEITVSGNDFPKRDEFGFVEDVDIICHRKENCNTGKSIIEYEVKEIK